METDLEPPTTSTTITTTTTTTASINDVVSDDDDDYIDDSNCSTPYVSAPSSPGNRTTTGFLSHPPPSGFFFYSAPTSPMHYVLSSSAAARSSLAPAASDASSSGSFEFEFSSRFESPAAPEVGGGVGGGAMSSADELFLNGQIRPMKLCAHLSRPQHLPPCSSENGDIIEDDEEEEDENDRNDVVFNRSRDVRLRDRSQRRRTRSMSPLRSTVPFDWLLNSDDNAAVSTPKKAVEGEVSETDGEKTEAKEFPSAASGGGSASSSRCSSAGRSSKRWVFLKDFLRSKSEGRSNNKFWQNMNISFSPAKEKEKKQRGGGNTAAAAAAMLSDNQKAKRNSSSNPKEAPAKKSSTAAAAAAKRRSAHEMHYAANRAQAEEMRKKTFLPYRQGLLGCLGFNSKSYGALNGFARALNPVSSR